jgi:hypothetical protein
MRLFFFMFLGMAMLCQATTTFTVAFTPDTLTGNPGDMISFSGTLLNNTSNTVFINSDSFTFAIAGAADDTPFLNHAPSSLGPNASSTPFMFLTVTIPNGQAAGIYDGSFTVLGGADGAAQNNLGSGAFHLTVDVVTPEPSTISLLAIGVAVLLCRRVINATSPSGRQFLQLLGRAIVRFQ